MTVNQQLRPNKPGYKQPNQLAIESEVVRFGLVRCRELDLAN